MCVFDCHGTGIPPCSWLHRGSRNQHLSHWTNSLSFGLDFRRLKLDVHVFPHKGILKARKRTLHRTAWFWEFAFLPVPWCRSRLLLSRLPAALGTSHNCIIQHLEDSFRCSKQLSQATRRSVHEGDKCWIPWPVCIYPLGIKSQRKSASTLVHRQSRWILIETEIFSGLRQCAVCALQWLRRDELHLTWPFLLESCWSLMGAVSEERHLRC